MEKTLVVIAGPTAVGKTACSIELALHFGSVIISADSRQIYRETTIGTAVPSREELETITHHFIQVRSLTVPFNASMYENQVLELLEALFRERNIMFLVGGSGLYIDAVCNGIDDLPSHDPQLRKRLQERLEKEGLETLTGELRRLDPVSFAKIDLKNPMRVLKALEVTIQTGKPYSGFLSSARRERPFRILRIALDMPREQLYERINRRVDLMMEQGLLREVEGLSQLRGHTALKTVGYNELFRYLDGELTLEEAVDLIKRNSRKFARKQLTWFRKGDRYTWFSPDEPAEIIRWIEGAL